MRTINMVVIDNDFGQIRTVRRFFENHNNIKVVKDFINGEEAVNYLVKEASNYDLILMDVALPGLDGATILDELLLNGISKKVIITSRFEDDKILKNYKKYNIINYYLKPVNLPALEKRIVDNYHTASLMVNGNNLDLVIYNVLHDLGIPSNLKGYNYLHEAIKLKYNDNSLIYITKDIYPKVADAFKTRVDNVERNIRHAIEVGIIRGNIDIINEVFKNTKHFEKTKPTNAEFICTIVERIKIDTNI